MLWWFQFWQTVVPWPPRGVPASKAPFYTFGGAKNISVKMQRQIQRHKKVGVVNGWYQVTSLSDRYFHLITLTTAITVKRNYIIIFIGIGLNEGYIIGNKM